MIKCNVTVCGTVTKTAILKTAQDGREYVVFKVNVPLAKQNAVPKSVEISVIKDGNDMATLGEFAYNSRIAVTGTLSFTKKEEHLFWNLRAASVSQPSQEMEEGITGTMDFWGTTGKQIEKRTSSKNKEYLLFSAYSTQKDGETFAYQWIRFMDFSDKQYDWLKEKTPVKVTGSFEAKYYNEHLDITCIVKEMSPWERKEKEQQNENQQG